MSTASDSINNSAASHTLPIIFRVSMWNHIVLVVGIFLSVIATIYSSIELPFTVQTLNLGIEIPFSIVALLPLVLVAKIIHCDMNSRLVLLQNEVVYEEGLLSWRSHTVRIEYQHIREIEINQTILQKLFNVGDIVILAIASSTNSDRIVMSGIKDPNHVKDLLESRRHSN